MKQRFCIVLAFVCLFLSNIAYSQSDSICAFDRVSLMDSLNSNVRYLHQQDVIRFRANNTVQFLPNGSTFGENQTTGLYSCRKATYIIPVVVHIIYDSNDVATNISDEQVESALRALNAHFSNDGNASSPAVNTGIQFCLAQKKPDGSSFSGITRRAHSLTTHASTSGNIVSLMNLDYLPHDQYLNIWVVKSILDEEGNNSGILGYATMPRSRLPRHGIVIDYKSMGNINDCDSCELHSFSNGSVLTHEAGHFLGLYHPFDGGQCAGGDSNSCAIAGDMCCDVPPVSGQQFECNSGRNTCHETPDLNDPIENYMDYSGPDCKTTFTANQTEVMHAALNSSRYSLITPTNVNGKELTCCHTSAFFETNIDFTCLPAEIVTLDAIEYTGATYRWSFFRNDTLVSYFSISNNYISFIPNAAANYSVKLTIVNNNDSISFTRHNILRVAMCNNLLANPQASWAFAEFGGIQFTTDGVIKNNGPLVDKPRNIKTDEGCISQANEQGKMLFYAAGSTDSIGVMEVYNKQYRRMQNSHGLFADHSAVQVGLSLPFPGNGKRYYLFCSYPHNSFTSIYDWGLRYSVVDTTLDGGLGGIVDTMKNVPINGPWFVSMKNTDSSLIPGEAITAVPKCNGSDYWLIVQASHHPTETFKGLLIYSVTANGIEYHDYYSLPDNYRPCQLKASPNGRYLAGFGKLFEFDRANGVITNMRTLTNPYQYGVSFSSDSRLLYMSDFFYSRIIQVDLLSDSMSATIKTLGFFNSGCMQLGPDEKIYITSEWQPYQLLSINNPNIRDSVPNACGFTLDGPKLSSGARANDGLPNMIDAKVPEKIPKTFDVTVKSCKTAYVRSNIPCANWYKWYFGDGDSASTMDATHTYNSYGVYTVSLVTSDTSITQTVNIAPLNLSIGADTLFCDTPAVIYLSATENEDYIYSWQILNNAATYISDSTNFNVTLRFIDEGEVRLIAKDQRTGCIDTTTQHFYRRIPPISSTTISSLHDTCMLNTTTLITGNRATGGSGQLTYLWRKKTKNGTWQTITEATDTFYVASTSEDSVQYIRVAMSSGCEKPSNTLLIRGTIGSNEISINQKACIVGQSFSVTGSNPKSTRDSSFTYLWDFSLNGTTWSQILGESDKDLSWIIPTDSVYIRRIVYGVSSGCRSYSNSLKVHPKIYFTQQPRDTLVCGPNVSPYFKVNIVNTTDSTIYYDWQRKVNADTSVWDTPAQGSDTNTFPTGAMSILSSPGDSIRCVILTPCGNIYSRVATLYVNNTAPQFALHPSSQTVADGTLVDFNSAVDSSYANRYGLRYYWQRSFDQGESWDFIPNENDKDYVLGYSSYCQSGMKFRAALFNGCSGYVYSNVATLTVSLPSGIQYNLMMRDASDDNGTEPYPNSNIWASPDIWFSRNAAATYDYNNNNIEYKKLQPTGYAKIQVKNIGTATSATQKAVLHWTVAATRELWPKHWVHSSDNYITNIDSLSQFYLDSFPRGGIIDTVTIPAISANGSSILVVPWEVPNPAWYGVNGNDSSLMVCLLARILSCDEKPHGMTYPEGLVTATNARNNRKIITRNFHVVDTNSTDKTIPIYTGNYWDANSTSAFRFKANNCDYFNYGHIEILFDDVLTQAWVNNGAEGSGFVFLEDSSGIQITDTCDVWLTNIAFEPNQEAKVRVRYVSDESIERTEFMTFDFEFFQYNQDELSEATPLAEGGMMMSFVMPENTAAHYLDNSIVATTEQAYRDAICEGNTPPYLTGIAAVTPAYWSLQWESAIDSLGMWTEISGATSKDYQPAINNQTMYYRRRATKQHTMVITHSPAFMIRLRDPHIISHPVNASLTEGVEAVFSVSFLDMEVVNWQRNHTGGFAIIQDTSSELHYPTQECNHEQTFQAQLRNVCTLSTEYTTAATLTVVPITDNLWAQDNTSGTFVWSSPDIVNRRSNDNGSTHQTPEYGIPNYIYTTVRNDGDIASAPAKLYLYWSVANTGAAWERNWKYDTTQSAETGNWLLHQGAKNGLGNLIGVFNIPSISSSGSYTIQTEWYPINPEVYGMENTALSDIILLGRIVTCEDSPFGMENTETENLGYNVRNNERVIAKNFVVTDVIPGNDVVHQLMTGNITGTGSDGKLTMKALDCDYFRYGYILLHLDATMRSIWSTTNGSGYTVVNDSTLRIDSCQDVELNTIEYIASQRAWLGVEYMTWDTLSIDTTLDLYYEFDLEQYMEGDDTNSVGGIRYGVPVHLEPPAPESYIIRTKPNQTEGKVSFSAYPNPFNNILMVRYTLPRDEKIDISITNLLGQTVQKVEENEVKTAGSYSLEINTTSLKEGIYFITFKAGNEIKQKKIVLIR